MCTHNRYITNYYNDKIFVPCGKCPACLQERAIKRANMIRNSFPVGFVALFVTLTYKNEFIPYIDEDEVDYLFRNNDSSVVNVPVRRDYDVNHFRIGSSLITKKFIYETDSPLFYIKIKRNHWYRSRSQFKHLVNSPSRYIGVPYFHDVQNFLKRLRIILNRNYSNYEIPIRSFQVSEVGPATLRPHFHLLLFIPFEYISFVKAAVVKAWSYADNNRTYRNIEVARDAASYVSSYINCHSYVPELFTIMRELRPKSSHSQGMGFDKDAFSLPEVLKSYRKRNLVYSVRDPRTGKSTFIDLPLPANVISRFFPKIKGYCRLTHDEILSIYSGRQSLESFAWRLRYTPEQIVQFKSLLARKAKFVEKYGISRADFGLIASEIWSIRKSNIIRRQYDDIKTVEQYFQLYDNIAEFFDGGVHSPTLYPFIWKPPKLELDANKFDFRVQRDNNLTRWYDLYDKSKKIRNTIYSKQHIDM